MLEIVTISFIEYINDEVRQDSNNTCINKINNQDHDHLHHNQDHDHFDQIT